MKSLALTYSPYNLNLTRSFKTSKGEISERRGFILSLRSSAETEGIGEASPLPEFGSESFEEDEKALKNIQLMLKFDLNNLVPSIEESLADFNHLPALRSGLEQAILNLICIERKTTLSELFNKPVSRNISVNGVIGLLNPEEALAKAIEFRKNSYRTLKIKLGREKFEDDYLVLKNVRNEIGKNIKIRVDVNGKWGVDEAINNLKQIEGFDIEYVEQPVPSIEDFIEIQKGTSIPLAADESLRSYDDAIKIIKNNLASVLILKPMMLGGLTTSLKIIDEAEKNNFKVVISSSFETSIGRSIAVFAAGILKQQSAHGLDVSDYFPKTIVKDPFPVNNGIIKLG